MTEDGYIKFQLHHQVTPPIGQDGIEALIHWRRQVYQAKLIGSYPNGIGYGNLSVRTGSGDQFLISASATGGLEQVGPTHFSLVSKVDPASNQVWCAGPRPASSESMSHGIIYQSLDAVQAVIHAHHRGIWEELLRSCPSTPSDVPYGTPEMAFAIEELLKSPLTLQVGAFAMAGHKDGVISFGTDLNAAGGRLLEYMNDEHSNT